MRIRISTTFEDISICRTVSLFPYTLNKWRLRVGTEILPEEPSDLSVSREVSITLKYGVGNCRYHDFFIHGKLYDKGHELLVETAREGSINLQQTYPRLISLERLFIPGASAITQAAMKSD